MIRITPEDGDAYHGRGFCYLNQGQYQKALADFDRGIELTPQVVNLYYNRAHTLAFLGRKSAAAADAKRCEELGAPMEPAFLKSLEN